MKAFGSIWGRTVPQVPRKRFICRSNSNGKLGILGFLPEWGVAYPIDIEIPGRPHGRGAAPVGAVGPPVVGHEISGHSGHVSGVDGSQNVINVIGNLRGFPIELVNVVPACGVERVGKVGCLVVNRAPVDELQRLKNFS